MTEVQTSSIAGQIAETISTYDKLMNLKKEAWHFRLTNNPNNSYHGKEDSPIVLLFNFQNPETARNIAYQVNEKVETGAEIEGEGRFLTCFYSTQAPMAGSPGN